MSVVSGITLFDSRLVEFCTGCKNTLIKNIASSNYIFVSFISLRPLTQLTKTDHWFITLDSQALAVWVPQGSVLCPLLFSVNIPSFRFSYTPISHLLIPRCSTWSMTSLFDILLWILPSPSRTRVVADDQVSFFIPFSPIQIFIWFLMISSPDSLLAFFLCSPLGSQSSSKCWLKMCLFKNT